MAVASGLFRWCHPLRPDPPSRCSCLRPSAPIKRPDPAIYSQQEQLSLGVAPTWNPDDILTNQRRPWKLLKKSRVTVRNLSTDASAINTLVHLYTSPFGIGTPRTALSTAAVNLAPGQQQVLTFPLTEELLSGDQRIGAHVLIEHSADTKTINNRGSQMVFGVFTSDEGRNLRFEFPVVNNTAVARQITLTVLENELSAQAQPVAHNFAPFEQIQATVTAQVPSTLHGTPADQITKSISVAGWAGGMLIDGVTFMVSIDD